jgi:ABC-type glycerol-3-phosphate transport system substrate-binding protein
VATNTPPSHAAAPGAAARPRGLSRRHALRLAAVPAVLAAACAPAAAPAGRGPAGLAGTFDLLSQANFAVFDTVLERVRAIFQETNPGASVTFSLAPYAELPVKIKATAAAGAGPDGFFHYHRFWRGVNAATVMLPLTPQVFRRNELERLTFANLLNSVWARNNEVYFLPYIVGLGGTMLLHNESLLGNAGVNPRSLTTLDAIVAAASRLTERQGSTITRAGLLVTQHERYVYHWVLDQGGKFYDDKTHRWTWQTAEAERALQWIVDAYDKHQVMWRTAPSGIRDALGEGHAATMMGGAFRLSDYALQYPDVRIADLPLPSFVPGKPRNYYMPEIAGFSLSPVLEPDEPKAKLGAALLREFYSPEGALELANRYSGALFVKGVYADPRFKDTRFGAARAYFPQEVIPRTVVIMDMAADPGIMPQINKVLAGELSVKAALAEMQQLHQAQDDEARRNMG